MLNLARKVTLLRFSASGDSFDKTIVFMMMTEIETNIGVNGNDNDVD